MRSQTMLAGPAVAAVAGGAAMVGRNRYNADRRATQLAAERPPIPPPLPAARTVALPDRGEAFFRDTGPAPGTPALLLHGWGATADLNFYAAYDPVAADRRVLAPDHRGHGRGMRPALPFTLEDCADDAAALIKTLGLPPVVAVGYSMGGPIAMLLAHRHPDLVAGLVVEATALEWSQHWWERLQWRGMGLVELGLRLGAGQRVITRFLERGASHRSDVAELAPWMASEFRRGDPMAVADAGRALAAYDARPWAASLSCPAACVVTVADRLVRPSKQRALAATLHAAVFELDADHDAPALRPEAFGEITRLAVGHIARWAEARQAAPAGVAVSRTGAHPASENRASTSSGVSGRAKQ
ncbi:MAG TPA: alpha/beta hydrolase [Acidimicrobiales bacterium]|nr:alpha/beta hydrolase [Acidimicrobiales bacterium]